MKDSDVIFRPMRKEELVLTLEWAAKEGWNPGLDDVDIFWATDPEGFLVAELNGEPVGTGAIISYGRTLGFMGLFLVRPDLRGRGIGRQLWFARRDLLRSRLEPDAPIGLDGVLPMQAFYANGGFVLSHQQTRHTAVIGDAPTRDQALDGQVCDLSELPFEQVEAFDRTHFGAKRSEFLKLWIKPKQGAGKAVLASDGSIRAMAVIRKSVQGYRIGPLFARDAKAAELALRALTEPLRGQLVCLDIPTNNPSALQLAVDFGMRPDFTCGRMYFGKAPALPWNQIYGVTTFELG